MNCRTFTELCLLYFVGFLLGSRFSAISPFYPGEALKRGNEPIHIGIVFAIFTFSSAVSSLVFGWTLTRKIFSAKGLLWIGLIVDSVATIGFGFIVFLSDSTKFFLLALFFRIFQGIGTASSALCGFTIISAKFPTSAGTYLSLFESAVCLGQIAGPTVGGVLYNYFGFTLTFALFGVLFAVVGLICVIVFQVPEPSTDDDLSILKTFKVPRVFVNVLIFIFSTTVAGFNEATLALHLRVFEMSPMNIGFIFITSGLTQALVSPVWGKISNKISRPRLLCGMGSIFAIACYVLVAPSPFFNLKPSLFLTVIAQVFLGLSIGSIYIPAFIDTIRYSINHLGYPDDVPTYGMLSGILAASISFGGATGSFLGGLLVNVFDYPWATQIMALLCSVSFVLIAFSISPVKVMQKKQKPKQNREDHSLRQSLKSDEEIDMLSTQTP